MKKVFDFCLESVLSFLYPLLCLHCRQRTHESNRLFCAPCASKMELIDSNVRCKACFCLLEEERKQLCVECRREELQFCGVAAAMDYAGPAASLVLGLKQGSYHYLSKDAGAWMVAQWAKMNWPVPDLIVPVPQRLTHWFDRGYNQSFLLAKAMGEFMNTPVKEIFRYNGVGGFGHTGLNHEQRLKQIENEIIVKSKKYPLADTTILIIDDVFTTGTTLRQCARALLNYCPARIYALTLCRTLS